MFDKGLFARDRIPVISSSFVFAIILATLFFPLLRKAPLSDPGVFLYSGWSLLEGKRAYIDFWDHKGPLVFAINALGIFLGGDWGVWGLQLLFLVLTFIPIILIVNESKTNSLTIFLILSIFSLEFAFLVQSGNLTEQWALPFQAWALAMLIKNKKSFLVTFSLSVGLIAQIMLRPNLGASTALCLVWLILFSNKPIKTTLYVLMGLVIGSFPFIVWFWDPASRSALIDAVLKYNLHYSDVTFLSRFISVIKCLLYLSPFIVLYIGAIYRRNTFFDKKDLFLALVFVIEVALSSLSWRATPHYFLVPMIPLVFGVLRHAEGLNDLSQFLMGRRLIFGIAILIVFVLGFYRFIARVDRAKPRWQSYWETVDYIHNKGYKNSEVLLWGNEAGIYYHSKIFSPWKYSYFHPILAKKSFNSEEISQMQSAVGKIRLFVDLLEYKNFTLDKVKTLGDKTTSDIPGFILQSVKDRLATAKRITLPGGQNWVLYEVNNQ